VPIPLQTVMQPKLKKRKSITKLTDAKTVSNNGASKYCLLTQGSDEQGIPEAKLYKVLYIYFNNNYYQQNLY
jgi:kinesin family member 23